MAIYPTFAVLLNLGLEKMNLGGIELSKRV